MCGNAGQTTIVKLPKCHSVPCLLALHTRCCQCLQCPCAPASAKCASLLSISSFSTPMSSRILAAAVAAAAARDTCTSIPWCEVQGVSMMLVLWGRYACTVPRGPAFVGPFSTALECKCAGSLLRDVVYVHFVSRCGQVQGVCRLNS
jgi:hypothetical protein